MGWGHERAPQTPAATELVSSTTITDHCPSVCRRQATKALALTVLDNLDLLVLLQARSQTSLLIEHE